MFNGIQCVQTYTCQCTYIRNFLTVGWSGTYFIHAEYSVKCKFTVYTLPKYVCLRTYLDLFNRTYVCTYVCILVCGNIKEIHSDSYRFVLTLEISDVTND